MNHNFYEKYAILEAKIEDLKTQKEAMRVSILEVVMDLPNKKSDTPFGKFSVSMLKKWTYTDKVSEAEDKFKAIKAKEESTGEATFTETPSLRFISVKL